MNKKIAVIGAGPAGLTAAYHLTKYGVEVEVFEAGNAVGGMAKTNPLWGQLVDLGPHRFFSSDPRVNHIWLEAAGNRYSMVQRLTRIYYKGTFFNYPLKPLNALIGLGPAESARCLLSYAQAGLQPIQDDVTFESWVTNRFGRRLFEIFFKSYSEKLWCVDCDQLDADFAAQRIKRLSLLEAVKSAFVKQAAAGHKTLADEFAYPHTGTGQVYERMASGITAQGGVIHLRAPIQVALANPNGPGAILVTENGERRHYDHIVSSMPLTQLVARMMVPESVRAAASQLTYRNTILVYLHLKGASPFPDQWIYVHSPELGAGRITNFRNWVPSINQDSPNTILCLEYWCNDPDSIWSADDEYLGALAERELYTTTLVPEGAVIDSHVVRVPRCYPVYASGYRRYLEPVQRYLATLPWLSPIGRYGAFKYNNQDHSILMGLLAAENIAKGAHHNLWDINTDYEYQESSRITATGLVSG